MLTFLTRLSAKDRLLCILFFLVVAIAAVYWPARSHDFVSLDDQILVYENKYYDSLTTENIWYFWREPHEQLYSPLTYTVGAVLAEAARVAPATSATDRPASALSPDFDPQIFHSFNLLLHVFNTLLAFALLRVLIKNDWAAAAGALLFGLHPVQVESVVWIAELKGVLSNFFGFLALWLYARYVEAKIALTKNEKQNLDAAESTPGQVRTFYLLAFISCVAALLSKPAALCLPLIAWLLDYWLRREPRRATLALVPWVLAVLPIAFMARQAQPASELFSPLWARPLVAFDAISFYLTKIFWPINLIPDYGRTPRLVIESGFVYWTWVLPVALGVLLWLKRKQWPGFVLGLGIFIAALGPVLGLVPFIFQYYSTVADRYLYLPMLGLALALAWALKRWPNRWMIGASVVVIIVLASLTTLQIPHWKDSATLYAYILRVNPNGWFALVNYASILELKEQEERAAAMYRKAIKLRPELPEPYSSLGALLFKQGKSSEAIDLYLKAVELSPTLVKPYHGLATAYKDIGKDEFALLALRRAAELEPDNFTVHLGLAELYLRTRKFQEAENSLNRAQKLAPNLESFYLTTAVLLVKHDLFTASLPYYVNALQLRPEDPTLHNDLGLTLLRLRNYQQAARAFENAIQIKPDYHQAYVGLGEAQLAQGQRLAARQNFEKALQIKPDFAPAKDALKKLS